MNHKLYVVILSVILLMVLTACSEGNSSKQNQLDENTMSQAVTDQPQDESEIEVTPGADTNQIEPTMPVETQPSSGELLYGEWYGDDLAKYEFRAGGAGVIEHLGDLTGFTWSIDGNSVTVKTNGTYETNFELMGDELHLINSEGTYTYTRTPSSVYLEANQELFQQEVHETTLNQKFLGEWYFDVFIWRFNDDGTGVIEIPEFNRNPAEEKKFEFNVIENQMGENVLSISLSGGKTIMYLATYANQSGGSVTLQPIGGGKTIMLTRSYDMGNSPITDEIIDEGISLFEGLTSYSGMGEMILDEIGKKK